MKDLASQPSSEIAIDGSIFKLLLLEKFPPNLARVTTSRACDVPRVGAILACMTNKISSWSYQDVADFLRENDFEFMEGLNSSKGAWVKLETNGEPAVILEFKFTPTQYSMKEIKRIMRLSKIAQDKWVRWAEAR